MLYQLKIAKTHFLLSYNFFENNVYMRFLEHFMIFKNYHFYHSWLMVFKPQ